MLEYNSLTADAICCLRQMVTNQYSVYYVYIYTSAITIAIGWLMG